MRRRSLRRQEQKVLAKVKKKPSLPLWQRPRGLLRMMRI